MADGTNRQTKSQPARVPKNSGSRHKPATSRKLSVLVADDTAAYERIISNVLRQRGHDVTFAKDGHEAIEYFTHGSFDAVVVDVQMPVIDGFEVTKTIRRRESRARHTPIIGLTAHSIGHREKCLEVGMDVCLPKPLDTQMLVSVIENLATQSTTTAGAAYASKGNHDEGGVVDFEGAMGRLGGDLELFQEFVKVYDEDVPPLMDSLRAAIEGRNGSVTERSAHSLRGLISNFGARKAVEAAAQIEENGKQQQWQDIDSVLETLEHQIALLTAALDKYRA